MKELSIEEKAKRYDEAIKVASDIKAGTATYITDGTPVIDAIFPELKESEDERIRKELIAEVKEQIDCIPAPDCRDKEDEKALKQLNKWLAWLEKQGEQKTADEIAKEVCKNKESAMAFLKSAGIMNEKGELAEQYRQGEQKSIDDLTQQEAMDIAVAKCFVQGEQKPTDKVEPKFKVGDIIKNKKNGDTVKVEQILSDSYCYSGWDGAATIHSDFLISDQDNWELVEQNPAWSEEDEQYLLVCKNALAKYQATDKWDANIISNWLENKLKSLSSQPKWKPSDEQMKQLGWIANQNKDNMIGKELM